MSWNFEEITATINQEIEKISDPKELESFRVKYLGRKGVLTEIYASFSSLSQEERPVVGKNANELKNRLIALIDHKKTTIESQNNSSQSEKSLDVSLPGVAQPQGHQHLLSQIIDEVCSIFEGFGFIVQDGPEIETEFHNFSALNIPIDHPSRDAFDTFYLEAQDPENKQRNLLLRSHTSPGQIHVMKANAPPIAVVIPGKVYRPDAVDATHSFMFHQVEGLLVDRDVKFSDLKGLITSFCQRFFGENIKMRFRPHFFPFTEPSAEVDIFWHKGWLEIMGCGMVHPHVFESVGYPRNKYTGLAFGMGVERMAMLKYGIKDIRMFYENDVKFLHQF